MKSYAKWAALALVAFSALSPALAATVPPDVNPGHWAYQAVEDLANKGLILGYPDGRFLGGRSLTRYEMATIIQRMLRYVDEQTDQKIAAAKPGDTPPPAPAEPEVTKAEVEEIQKLVDEFKVELTVIGTDMEKVKADIAELQGLKDQVESINSTVGGLSDQIKLHDQSISDLQATKVGGYIQARYQSAGGIYKAGAKPDDYFFVRRGRVKITHTSAKSDYVFQFGGEGQNAFDLKDAYVTWKLGMPVTDRAQTEFWFGQFNTPFGYELERSDSENEFPERSLAENVLFNGERDRGVKFVYGIGPKLTFDASLLNGGAVKEPFTDDNFKDYTARLKANVTPWWDFGISGYWGKKALQTAAVAGKAATNGLPGSLVFKNDTNGDGTVNQNDTPSFIPPTAGTPAVAALPGLSFTGKRTRFGADTQLYILGGALRAEGYVGRQPVSAPTTNALPAKTDLKYQGWYAMYTYNMGKANILGIRYDTYDPDRDAQGDATTRWNASWNHFIGTDLKLTASYEWFPKIPTGNLDKGRWVLQAQHKF